MSAKLDKSLDEIVSSRRVTARGRGRPRRVTSRAAPAGGIQKSARATATKATTGKTAKAAAVSGNDSKIIVSNLPGDVTEQQIKDYFSSTVGGILKVALQYGPNGVSRGNATVIFKKPGMANDAVAKLNGILVDKRPMKVELVVDASRASEPAKTLGDRVTKSTKAQPKQAGTAKATESTATRGVGRPVRGSRGRVRRDRNAGRSKPKTTDELDAEMTDYFTGGPETNGTTAAVSNGDATASGNNEVSMDGIA